jgi:hypothetical protein
MTHDFAMLCTIAKTVLLEQDNKQANVPLAWDAPDTPARQEVRAKYQAKKRAHDKKLESLINKCHALNSDRVAIAHGLIWFEEDGGGRLHHIPKSLKSDHPPKDADHIVSKADCACSLRAEIDKLLPFFPSDCD